MGLNIDDYQNEETWITGVRRIQVSENGPTKTSASAPGVKGPSSLTTYNVSEIMQGAAFYKPKGATLDLFNQTLSKDFEGLRTEKYYVEDKALSPYDVFVGVPNEEPDIVVDVPGGQPAPTTPTTAGEPPGQTYFMGDSLTVGLEIGQIKTKLDAKGYTPNTVNADGGRSISGPGMVKRTSGLQAIDTDAAFIKDCKHVIVALGTNLESNFDARIAEIMGKIKGLAPTAKFWWVDIGATGINHTSAAAANRAIYSQAGQIPFTVISQFKFLWGEDKDPQAYNISGSDPQGLLSSDGVHYSGGASYGKYADFIVSKLPAGAPIVTGGDNATIIWNYLIGKGLPPFQAAGIMGNMQAESGFEPRRVQYGTVNSRGQVSVAGQDSALDDTPASGGYGIVQFTPGTKILPAANAQKRRPGDIMFQLDHVWEQLTTGNEKLAGNAIFATANLEDATSRFLDKYERPAVNNYAARIALAKEILKRFAP